MTKETWTSGDLTLTNVHSKDSCGGDWCVIHNPKKGHWDSWTLHWRADSVLFERICPCHGVGHPDPSQFDFWTKTNQSYKSVHGCVVGCPCTHDVNKRC